ncbi:MAG: pyridoxamine 5'-phosphate oxidase family protein [Candidatus Tectomicrobia bacterium]|jgi:PPOX class probable F420-dependent enzyme|nr:pyridoxamine 5'-phosphate oxidase family protein [Candidatus Tectomicrobia bacterium]
MPEQLADARIQQFLSGKEVVVLCTVQRDGAPLAMPMWFLHTPEALYMVSVDGLQKVRNLRRDPRLCVVAEAGNRGAAIKGVVIQGRAEFIVDPAQRRPIVGQLLDKYDPDLVRLWGGRTMPPNRVLFRVAAEKVRSWGL